MSGRGRGSSNFPSWENRGDGGPENGGGPGGGPPHHYPPMDRGPPRDDFGRGPPRDFDRRGGGGGGGGYDRGRYDDRGGRHDDRRDSFRDRGRRGGPPPMRGGGGRHEEIRRSSSFERRPNQKNPGTIMFRSYEEEQQWVAERRRKRLARPSKFDVMPTPEQAAADAAMAAMGNPAATDFSGINAADRNFSAVPQQTRHARRLYVGQLPPNVTEDELHSFFRGAIEEAILPNSPGTVNGSLEEDPILSVYINHERRFCFLEFKTVEMTTACMDLDGIDIRGKGKVKIKRPNDYNPAMAPKTAPQNLPKLDTSKLGIINGTVPDGPNKIFVGGLHYHLIEDQVLELLQAFGKVKAFHLVKNDPDSMTSKGYCFVEYADPAVTQVAVMGLNGMDLGGGKMLTARVAGERSGAAMAAAMPTADASPIVALPQKEAGIPANANIVQGYDIEALVDAAMGLRPMPTAPMYLDSFGVPLTRLASTGVMTSPMASVQHQPPVAASLASSSALDIANAALAAAYGNPGSNSGTGTAGGGPTRVLVLSNMVTEEDLSSDEDFLGLQEEVREECAKFGHLRGMQIPRRSDRYIEPSAILKIFLEYATIQDAQAAERELKGRKFGDSVVQTSFFPESDYSAGKLR